jgi:dihydrofolate synthase
MSIHLSLDRIRALQKYLPAYTRPTCHIAGTNGKGSVSALLSSIFATSGLSVGRFNSPHLLSVRDSIAINGQSVRQSVYESARSIVENANADHVAGASNFEILSLTALLIFERERVDVAIVEVGMGGRLDATNAISDSAILVSGVTAIDLDHVAFLGPTLLDIAQEKAGIARTGKALVLGTQPGDGVRAVVEAVANGLGAQVVHVRDEMVTERGRNNTADDFEPLDIFAITQGPPARPVRVSMECFDSPIDALLPLHGDHQLANLAVAAAILSTILTHPTCAHFPFRHKIVPDTIARGIQSTSWPGRLSFHTITLPSKFPNRLSVLVDGAHNAAAAECLSNYISKLLRECLPSGSPSLVTLILGLSHSPQKSPAEILSPLLRLRNHARIDVVLVGFSPVEEMPWVRCIPPKELEHVVQELAPDVYTRCPTGGQARHDVDKPLVEALEWAASQSGDRLTVVAGSLYVVADFYRFLEKANGGSV